ncbi:uncharacterized protein LOC130199374 isoform X7 [Pseudoliparis swirei]|uniref:uncharacterized protein LOC130199374 isoform X7 n=1 Tax=Pseudoliparis swirei TaxID=2059687 RepID=UPI0024BF1014|nr:uncharacterized protein LOC130199374 isoform X7 [Pseudoliparis swirei]
MGFFWRIYACPSLPFFCLYTPLLLFFSPLPSWQRCQSGQADRGKHSTGQSGAEGDPKAGELIMYVPLSPCVRTDALTPVGGDCGKGVSLSEGVLYSSLFPSSRHHGPLLLQSSGPARRSRTGSRSERRPSKPWPLKAGCDAAVYSHKPWALNHFHEQKQRIRHRDKRELPLWIFAVEAMWMLSLGLRRQPSQQPADCHLQMGNHAIQSECTCALINMSHCVKHFFCSESRLNMFVFPNRTNACGVF